MSIPLKAIRDRVNGMLNNHDFRKPGLDEASVDQKICDVYMLEAARLPAPSSYTASAFTISAGGDTFTLPNTVTGWTLGAGGAEYAGDVRIQLVSNGEFLLRVTREEIEGYKDNSPAVVLGIPRRFALFEVRDQDLQGLCYPGALAAEACNLYRTLTVDDPRDFTGGMDASELQFSRIAATALQFSVAADFLESMTDEDLAIRRLNRKAAAAWRQRAEVAFYQEQARRHSIKDAGRFQRWVS